MSYSTNNSGVLKNSFGTPGIPSINVHINWPQFSQSSFGAPGVSIVSGALPRSTGTGFGTTAVTSSTPRGSFGPEVVPNFTRRGFGSTAIPPGGPSNPASMSRSYWNRFGATTMAGSRPRDMSDSNAWHGSSASGFGTTTAPFESTNPFEVPKTAVAPNTIYFENHTNPKPWGLAGHVGTGGYDATGKMYFEPAAEFKLPTHGNSIPESNNSNLAAGYPSYMGNNNPLHVSTHVLFGMPSDHLSGAPFGISRRMGKPNSFNNGGWGAPFVATQSSQPPRIYHGNLDNYTTAPGGPQLPAEPASSVDLEDDTPSGAESLVTHPFARIRSWITNYQIITQENNSGVFTNSDKYVWALETLPGGVNELEMSMIANKDNKNIRVVFDLAGTILTCLDATKPVKVVDRLVESLAALLEIFMSDEFE